jgi:tryptophanyl-tRNA synthetase
VATYGIVRAMAQPKERVLSGIQPSGVKHLGNYFGAIVQHIALQEEFSGECFYFIADYHALTTLHDAGELRLSVRDLACTYLALGLDPDKALLFRQSDVPEVTELSWLLATVTGMGLLERATSYKDKITRGLKPNVGLFTYPVLMTADILIYGSSLVPVGKDQIQHIEIAQDIATYFNQTYSPSAPILRRPEFRLSHAPLVPGTDGQKMSTSYGNTIPIFASGKPLRKVVGGIVTDSTALGEPLDPERCTVFALLTLFLSEEQRAQVAGYYRTGRRDGEPFGYGHAKQMLAERIEQRFAPARERLEEYQRKPEVVDDILAAAATRARAAARETIERCKSACGLR